MLNTVLIEKDNNTAWLTMNLPASFNAMSAELSRDLLAAIADCETDAEVRVVVLTGAGRGFCAGGDLKAISGFSSVAEAEEYVHLVGSVHNAIRDSAKPYIAMVNGAAAGAGFNLVLACDLVIADSRAKFTQAFNAVGLVADCGGNYLLPRLVGLQKAKELILLPRTIDAATAQSLGLVNQLAEADELRERTAILAAELATRSRPALAANKRLLNSSFGLSWQQMLTAEEQAQAELMLGEDCREGISAYFDKRVPKFL